MRTRTSCTSRVNPISIDRLITGSTRLPLSTGFASTPRPRLFRQSGTKRRRRSLSLRAHPTSRGLLEVFDFLRPLCHGTNKEIRSSGRSVSLGRREGERMCLLALVTPPSIAEMSRPARPSSPPFLLLVVRLTPSRRLLHEKTATPRGFGCTRLSKGQECNARAADSLSFLHTTHVGVCARPRLCSADKPRKSGREILPRRFLFFRLSDFSRSRR